VLFGPFFAAATIFFSFFGSSVPTNFPSVWVLHIEQVLGTQKDADDVHK
jgi:hypothetical protein